MTTTKRVLGSLTPIRGLKEEIISAVRRTASLDKMYQLSHVEMMARSAARLRDPL
jgi:hypothetical protein